MIDDKTQKQLKTTLKRHARALDIPDGAAETFIDLSIKAAAKSLKKKSIITENDLIRAVTKELKKYNSDLAYVYKNYDKII